jgi:hypothetical protein
MGAGGEERHLELRNPCSLSGVLFEAADAGSRKAARDLLANAVLCHQACGAAYCRSRNYRSAEVASAFLKAVYYP